VLDEDKRDLLMEDSKKGSNSRITVDLQSQEIIRPDGSKILFEIDQYKKHCLIEGLDDVALTLEKNSKIDTFEVAMKDNFPWL
jgi:3-isopropylmalate/(R)-2-methylmalate dehydratase small subunit